MEALRAGAGAWGVEWGIGGGFGGGGVAATEQGYPPGRGASSPDILPPLTAFELDASDDADRVSCRVSVSHRQVKDCLMRTAASETLVNHAHALTRATMFARPRSPPPSTRSASPVLSPGRPPARRAAAAAGAATGPHVPAAVGDVLPQAGLRGAHDGGREGAQRRVRAVLQYPVCGWPVALVWLVAWRVGAVCSAVEVGADGVPPPWFALDVRTALTGRILAACCRCFAAARR